MADLVASISEKSANGLRLRWIRHLALLIALSCSPTSAFSLQYKLIPLEGTSVAITFTGYIVPGDFDRFRAFIDTIPSNANLQAIFLDSGGGNLFEASKLAELFNNTQPLVIVASGSQCTSACFLMFAAAGRRAVAPDGLIGVHSASDDGHEDINSMAATTLFARDASRYGVPASIIGKMVQTESNRVTWLDPSDLAAMNVQIIESDAPTGKIFSAPYQNDQSPQPKEDQPVGASGSWIQIYSRPLFSEAVSLATNYNRDLPNIRIFKCENGWYAVALGPYGPQAAVETWDRLVQSGTIPADSLVTQGVTFRQLAWGGDEITGSNPSSAGAVVALNSATEFFRSWTRSNREALDFLDHTYPPQVLYFGKRSSKAYVMAEKQAFAERWPQRAYSIRPGSVSTSCDPQEGACTVTGIVDWRASSMERNATSTGSARFQLSFSTQGQPMLISEWTEVLTRHAGP